MYGRPASSPQRSRWLDLPPDLLREISGRLLHASNFVRFHAVCRAWRSSHDPAASNKQIFLPWLLAPSTNHDDPLKLRCVFAQKSYLAPLQSSVRGRDWVGSVDGTALRYFTARPCPALHDPFVAGAVPAVLSESFPCQQGLLVYYPNGIVYSDGTILLYANYYLDDDKAELKVAILRPGDATWMVLERTLESPDYDELYVAYHGGKILVTEEASSVWHILTPPETAGNTGDVLVPRPPKQEEGRNNDYHHSYLVESQGELLWVSVNVHDEYPYKRSLVQALSVSVYVLDQEAPAPEKTRWVRKHWWSLLDRVVFLGNPNSFSLDASRLDTVGGCTYFVCYNNYEASRQCMYCVIRYNLVNDKAEIVDWLPQTLENSKAEIFEWLPHICREKKCSWLILQPTMAPIQEIRVRLREARKWKRSQKVVTQITPRSIIEHVIMPLQPCFRILVSNLPLSVNSSRLKYFFSKHGKVSSAEIICYKKTRTSQGKGFVTMATTHARQADALATLSGLVWDGHNLEVRLVDKAPKQQQRPSPRRAEQLHIARCSRS